MENDPNEMKQKTQEYVKSIKRKRKKLVQGKEDSAWLREKEKGKCLTLGPRQQPDFSASEVKEICKKAR